MFLGAGGSTEGVFERFWYCVSCFGAVLTVYIFFGGAASVLSQRLGPPAGGRFALRKTRGHRRAASGGQGRLLRSEAFNNQRGPRFSAGRPRWNFGEVLRVWRAFHLACHHPGWPVSGVWAIFRPTFHLAYLNTSTFFSLYVDSRSLYRVKMYPYRRDL